MYTLSWAVASLVAPLLAGTVIDRFGAPWLWGTTAGLGTVAAVGYWLLMRNLPRSDGGVAGAGASGAGAGAPAPASAPAPAAAEG
ncbi:hypothetical protein [Streptomyces avidinii]